MITTFSFKLKCPNLFSNLLNLFFGLTCLNAQIVYTNIEPDFASTNLYDFYNLDLNNDGIQDFLINSTFDEVGGDVYMIISTDSNDGNGVICVYPWYTHPEPLDYEMEIFTFPRSGYNWGEDYSPYSFFSIGYCFGGETSCFYNWENSNDKYLGLRFLISGQTHYGWARLDVSDATHWVIKDYAYQAVPDTMILAGEKSVLGLNGVNSLKNLKITTSNKVISVYNLNETLVYTLFSITGQSLLNGSISKEKNMINTSLLSSGVYIIELTSPQTGQVIKKKIPF